MATTKAFYLDTADFDKHFDEYIRSVSRELAGQALFDGANALLDAAENESPQTPQKRGELRASRRVLPPVIASEKVSVSCGYNKVYAAYQHAGVRKDGSHVVKNYTRTVDPNPGKQFLELKMLGDGGRRIMAVVADYIRRKTGGSPR